MKIFENYSLKKLNTFGIAISANYFFEINTLNDAHEIVSHPLVSKQKKELLVLGGGSNILFTQNYTGLVVKNSIQGIEVLKEDDHHLYVKVGAGEKWHHFVLFCIKNNYAGVENLSLIPGSVGAAPIQNIGAYGVEQKQVFHELSAINLHTNETTIFSNSDCKFGYRDSIFKHQAKGCYLITHVTFRLSKKPNFNTTYGAIEQELTKMGEQSRSLAGISQAVCNIRRSKLPDPELWGNAGSFFKNPIVSNERYELIKKKFPTIQAYADAGGMKLAAGWLIEQCGWKGKQVGKVASHKDQALVLVNCGGASGKEVVDLSENIMQSVKQTFDVGLEREVVVL
jgi:UDP-N-acetylmuramate dehydrogenase